jgi:hypothetical protein
MERVNRHAFAEKIDCGTDNPNPNKFFSPNIAPPFSLCYQIRSISGHYLLLQRATIWEKDHSFRDPCP